MFMGDQCCFLYDKWEGGDQTLTLITEFASGRHCQPFYRSRTDTHIVRACFSLRLQLKMLYFEKNC